MKAKKLMTALQFIVLATQAESQRQQKSQKTIKISELNSKNILGSLEFNVKSHLKYDNNLNSDIDSSEIKLDLGKNALRQVNSNQLKILV